MHALVHAGAILTREYVKRLQYESCPYAYGFPKCVSNSRVRCSPLPVRVQFSRTGIRIWDSPYAYGQNTRTVIRQAYLKATTPRTAVVDNFQSAGHYLKSFGMNVAGDKCPKRSIYQRTKSNFAPIITLNQKGVDNNNNNDIT